MAKKNFYAVKVGKTPGVYNTWPECSAQVQNFPGAVFKGFATQLEAVAYLNNKTPAVSVLPSTVPASEAVAYTDGSFESDLDRYSYGVVMFHGGKEIHFCDNGGDPNLLSMRNVAGEILGAQKAIQYCLDNDIKSLTLCYDYQGIEKWATGEWKANKAGTQSYAAFCGMAKHSLDIKFVKIAAHTGNENNEKADALAKQALYFK